jgi:type I restriction-modification system DNA methylase subunit
MEGIVSQERVKEFGEVFTPDSIVNDMLDMVDEQFKDIPANEYISKTFLEPSCGDGQFLIRILYRKLLKVKELPANEQKLALLKSLSTIYGVDIQKDNVIRSRERMLKLVKGEEVETFDIEGTNKVQLKLDSIDFDETFINTIKYIIDTNIIHGDTLDTNNPVIITEWQFNGDKVKATEFALNELAFSLDTFEECSVNELVHIKEHCTTGAGEFDFY